ncbi:MAG: hypothetical protein C5B48_05110 [Candidatus Rokuibacteriota bacterium]|nr:MAG: hypothetical protein C5B48_05110 [Candidatus Rokubacteria bacterium]
MEFRALGPLEVYDDGRLVALGGPRARALLAILLLRRGEVVPAERLIEELYGDAPPKRAANTVHVQVSRLRKALDSRHLRTVAGGYMLDVGPGEVDMDTFHDLVTRGRRALAEGDPTSGASALREALALWRGPPFADFRYSDFAQGEIARLEERRLGAVEDRVEADLTLGRHADLVSELEAIVAEFPLRERPRAQLMLALYRSGRQAEALEAYSQARRILTEELGLDPSGELKTLQRAILEHDPAIAPPPRVEITVDASARARDDFVGRSTELSTLRDALEDARAGHGGLVLVSGDPGIGKSRLADELLRDARRAGTRVLVGRCWEAGGAPAYWPWVQSLRAYIHECETGPLREQLGAGASDLAQLLPDLNERFPDLAPPLATEGEGARFRLFDAATTFLRAAARHQPLLIVLDDLHAGDEPSLLLLQFLARELADSQLLVVGLYRDVDPTLRAPLAPALAELTREPITLRLHLTGLASAEVADFVERASGATPSDELVTAIYAETDGNPLFVGELVRLLAAEGQLDAAGPRLSIPQSIREVIGRRVQRLGEEAAYLLTLASVLGREFELEVLAHLGRRSVNETLSHLDDALAERVVGDVPDARDRLRFSHQLIRDTLYDTLTAARRMQLHRQAGEALEAVYSSDREPHLAEIALHFFLSSSAGTADKAIHYARRAGDRAVALLAYEEAIRLYEMAFTLVEDDSTRCELLLSLGDVQARSGDTRASNATFSEAAKRAEALGRADQLAQAALGYGGRLLWEVSRDDEQHASLLERALDALGEEDSPLRVKLLARLAGGPLRAAEGQKEKRAALGRTALSIARRIGDPALVAFALHGRIEGSLLAPDQAHERLELSGELVEAALAAGEMEPAVEGYEERVLTLIGLGDRRRAEIELEAMGKLAEKLRQPAQLWLVAVLRALLALHDGRLEAAEELVFEARKVGERTESWNVAVSHGLQLFLLRREQGRLTEIDHLIRTFADRYASYVIWRCVFASAALALGRVTDGQAELDALARDDFAGIPFDEQWLVSLTLLAEAAAALNDQARATSLYRLLLPFEDRVAVSYPEISTGSVARSLGMLAATAEQLDDACRHFETGIAMNERVGARSWLARTQHDCSNMLLKRGALGDQERSNELRRAAEEIANEIGMSLG